MVRETGLTTGSCTGEENIGAEVVNDHTCEANSEHYKTPTKLFVLVEKPKVLENTNNQVQIIKYIYIDDMCLNKNNIVVNNQLKAPLQDIPGDPADIICHPHSLHMDQWW